MKTSILIAVLLLSLINQGCSATVEERQVREQSTDTAINWYKMAISYQRNSICNGYTVRG